MQPGGRMKDEFRYWDNACFIALTYSPETLNRMYDVEKINRRTSEIYRQHIIL